MEFIDAKSLDLLLLFFIYGIIGWLIEFIYRYVANQKFINPGFLFGPMLPIYGFSALTIIEISAIFKFNFFLNILLGMILVTLFEYIVASFCEKFIGVKFWDYSDTKFNYKGRISLEFSIVWGILILFLLYFVHPFVLWQLLRLSYYFKEGLLAFFLLYFIFDLTLSILALLNIRKIFLEFDAEITKGQFRKNIKRLSRILGAFPDLYLFIRKRIRKDVREFEDWLKRL